MRDLWERFKRFCNGQERLEQVQREHERAQQQKEQAAKQARAELRDRFAMAALTGLLAEGLTGELGREKRAANAWQEADAMLKARGDD